MPMPRASSAKRSRRRSKPTLSDGIVEGLVMPGVSPATREALVIDSSSSKPATAPGWDGPSTLVVFATYFGYAMLYVMGHLRDLLGRLVGSRYQSVTGIKGYAPLLHDWENFYTRRMYHRIQDCWSRPIQGPPLSNGMVVMERKLIPKTYTLEPTGNVDSFINLGSYNYLGFADDWRETCAAPVVASLDRFSTSSCASMCDAGVSAVQAELEETVAAFVGKPRAIAYSMGYGTNAASIPALMGPGSLILSDKLNHASIVNGARHSGSTIRTFEHNCERDLERLLREAIITGQPETRRPWRKILVIIEGVYSMEGEIANLKALVRVAKQYKAYVMLDEAHSIGALGKTGRGACEHCGVDPADMDVLMGTFTKSYGAMGGYIAGSTDMIEYLRQNSSGSVYGTAMSPIVAQQILRAFEIIIGKDGSDIGQQKLQRIKDNANYFRGKLLSMGCQVSGDRDSPVVPLMLYNPAKIAAFSRECFKRNLAVVVVGFPATSLIESRARFCISAGHTRADIDEALEKIEQVVDLLHLRYRTHLLG